MFGRQETRTHKAERIAAQAWEDLATAVDAAGSSTRSAGRRAAGFLDDTTNRVGSGAKEARRRTQEARRRAGAALDALAGRRRPTPWGWLATATFIGAVLGSVAGVFGRRAISRTDLNELPMSLEDDAILDDSVRR